MSAEPKVGDDGTISTPGAVDFFRVVNAQVRHCALTHLQHLLPCYTCSKAVPYLAAFATWLVFGTRRPFCCHIVNRDFTYSLSLLHGLSVTLGTILNFFSLLGTM